MEKTVLRLTVFFEEPFWIGLLERGGRGGYEVSKITFGAEPKDYEIYDFMLKNYGRLRFSPATVTKTIVEQHGNPKRMQRSINKQLLHTGIGTKAQQALKLQQEQGKLTRKTRSREEREAAAERRFALHQSKLKAKHRGH